ncbi:MAG TPA: hypothetical protein VIL46_03745, partial [Gemmataceae bacterium]
MIGPEARPKPRRSFRARLVRLVALITGTYLGIVVLFAWLENRLVYRPLTVSQWWEDPPDPAIEDVWLTAEDGTRLHAWWYPVDDSARGAVLICHGNAGNLSGRGNTVLRFGKELGRSVFIFDYPGYGKSEGKPGEARCYAAADAAYRWLV